MKIICVILAGGKSSRMGRDKALLPIGKETFLTHLIATYSPAFLIYVSVGRPERFSHPGAGELVDLHPGMGPLAGLEAAFSITDADAVFLSATDLPFGTLELAEELVEQLGDADACVIRRQDGSPEPTFAVYRRTCLPVIGELFRENLRAFRVMYDRIRVQWVEEQSLAEFNLETLLQNVNTPEEYAASIRRKML